MLYINFTDLIIKGGLDIISNQRTHIILPNGKHEIMDFSMTHVRNIYLGNIYIINFTKSQEKYSISSISSLYNIKDELSKLKPYLNRAGRNMVDSLLKNHFKNFSKYKEPFPLYHIEKLYFADYL